MTGVIFTVGLIVWLVAAYAFVRLAVSFVRIWRAAPAGQARSAATELWSLNYPAVRQRVGEAAAPAIETFRRSVGMFAVCAGGLIVLVLINLATGNAA
jgi:hypothetical protein